MAAPVINVILSLTGESLAILSKGFTLETFGVAAMKIVALDKDVRQLFPEYLCFGKRADESLWHKSGGRQLRVPRQDWR